MEKYLRSRCPQLSTLPTPAVPSPPIVSKSDSGGDQFRPPGSVIGRSAPAAPPETQAATPCVPGSSHKPASQHVNDKAYWLYEAAWDGCLPCVRRLLVDEASDPASRYHSQGYNVLDWAVVDEEIWPGAKMGEALRLGARQRSPSGPRAEFTRSPAL